MIASRLKAARGTRPEEQGMPVFPRGAIVAAAICGLAASSMAGAQAMDRPIHHKAKTHVAARRDGSPTAPGVELRASTSASPGSENHYYSDTVASSHSDLMDMTHRYGQSSAPQYNSSEPLFRF
jgi:hypothetical protein